MKTLKTLLIGLVSMAMFSASLSANAAMIGTEQMLGQSARAENLATVERFISREAVQSQMLAWGVAPEDAQTRVAALSDAELQQLAQNIEAQPAGAGVIEVVGIVFVVLLILELTGVIDIFKAI